MSSAPWRRRSGRTVWWAGNHVEKKVMKSLTAAQKQDSVRTYIRGGLLEHSPAVRVL